MPGAGLGGMVAAVRSAELGQRVILVEAGDFLGGTPMFSGGPVHIMDLLLSAFDAEHAIVVNAQGTRFVDEGTGELNGETINAAAAQDGDLWIVMDGDIREGHPRYELPAETLRSGNWRYARRLAYTRLGRSAEGRRRVTFDSLRFACKRRARIICADDLATLTAPTSV